MISANERAVIRDLAKKLADLANQPIMEERRKLWYAHNDLKTDQPVICHERLGRGLHAGLHHEADDRRQGHPLRDHPQGHPHHPARSRRFRKWTDLCRECAAKVYG